MCYILQKHKHSSVTKITSQKFTVFKAAHSFHPPRKCHFLFSKCQIFLQRLKHINVLGASINGVTSFQNFYDSPPCLPKSPHSSLNLDFPEQKKHRQLLLEVEKPLFQIKIMRLENLHTVNFCSLLVWVDIISGCSLQKKIFEQLD